MESEQLTTDNEYNVITKNLLAYSRVVRGGSADTTEVETGLQEVDLLTRLKWRQDCKRWIC